MNETKVSCKDVVHHICESLGEELNSAKCIAIKEHLDRCSDCKNYFKSVEITIDFYKKYEVELPPKAHERLMSVLGLSE